MPINYSDYNPDFRETSRRVRFERENGRCQLCGRQHGETYEKTVLGKFGYDPGQTRLFDAGDPDPPAPRIRVVTVVLTTAHLDHDTRNDADENLAALCSACHLNYDRIDNAFRSEYGKNFLKVAQPIDFSQTTSNSNHESNNEYGVNLPAMRQTPDGSRLD